MHTEKVTNNQSEKEITVLTWRVEENLPDNDYLKCAVYENDKFQYRLKVLKNDKLRNAKADDIIRTANVTFNFMSPDGFSISREDFSTQAQAESYFELWKKGYERQGYYSSNDYGRIELASLPQFCQLIRDVID